MKRSQLFREWARVIDMVDGTKVKPYACVKLYDNGIPFNCNPKFTSEPSDYKFAIAIVEGKPAFKGDTLYLPNGVAVVAGDTPTSIIGASASWNPPKRTFALNGEEFPLPVWDGDTGELRYFMQAGCNLFYWKCKQDRDRVEAAIINLLEGKSCPEPK